MASIASILSKPSNGLLQSFKATVKKAKKEKDKKKKDRQEKRELQQSSFVVNEGNISQAIEGQKKK